MNIAGEKTSEDGLLKAVEYFEAKTNIKIAEFCAYVNTTKTPACYVVLLEPVCDIDINKLKEYEKIMEEGLETAFGYKYEVENKNINPAKLNGGNVKANGCMGGAGIGGGEHGPGKNIKINLGKVDHNNIMVK